jgi:hypothetical protein
METPETRSNSRRFVALIVIGAATAQSLGVALRIPTQLTANDISRYCTVWSLLEKGTYAIDDCPWAKDTQDKVQKADPFSKDANPPLHYYSSKPPLFSTLMAGVIYPFRKLSGVALDHKFEQIRIERNVEKADPDHPGQTLFVKETPAPVIWQAYILYFKPVIILFNVLPFLIFLILYVRLLDRYAPNDWAWFVALFAGAWGNYLVVFNSSLNNHTVAAYSAFFAIYALSKILDGGLAGVPDQETDPATSKNRPTVLIHPWQFVMAGFWAAFCSCNEIPAGLFGGLLFLILFVKAPRQTLVYFVPAAIVPLAAFFVTQYLAFGQLKPVYEEFGTKSYNYEGSYWNTPLEFDWFNKFPESYPVYLFHMTIGHHGVFSLSPIFLFSMYACLRNILGKGRSLKTISWLTMILTVAMLTFYTINPKARNYGGSTSGLRWLFWLIPFWLVVLPTGLAGGQDRRWVRWVSLAALCFSVLSAGYALRSPWTHPWIVDLLEHLNLYQLVR